MSTNITIPNRARDAGWVNRLLIAQAPSPEYQEPIFALHRKLLERINLEVLSALGGERVRGEIRAAVAKLLDEESTPLSRLEKERITEEVLNEVFGLGPLEPLLQDPTVSDILVTTPHLVYVERHGKLHRTPVEFKDIHTCFGSSKRSSRGWAGAWMSLRLWWTPGCPTARV